MQLVRYHDLRQFFVIANHLPRNFNFANYLKKCKLHVTRELVEIDVQLWIVIVFVFAFDLFIYCVTHNHVLSGRLIPYITSTITIVLCFITFNKVCTDSYPTRTHRVNSQHAHLHRLHTPHTGELHPVGDHPQRGGVGAERHHVTPQGFLAHERPQRRHAQEPPRPRPRRYRGHGPQ